MAVAEERSDYDEVFLGAECIFFADEPFVVSNCCDGQLLAEETEWSTHSQNTSLDI